MSKRYVKCSCCGKVIYEDDDCVVDASRIGIFCGLYCWARHYGVDYIRRRKLTQNLLECDGSIEFEVETKEE